MLAAAVERKALPAGHNSLEHLQAQIQPLVTELTIVAADNGGKSLAVPKTKSLQCQYCDNTFSSEAWLAKHEKLLHSIACANAVSKPCTKMFLIQRDANKHKREVCLKYNG
jgi:uncharacterized Zn-finger protein